MGVRTKRVYDPAEAADGRRYLVDRLWPRGLSKAEARLDGWLKELSPSPELRTWYGHEPNKFPEFRARYLRELRAHARLVDRLVAESRRGTVTLLFAARDAAHCNATVLNDAIRRRLRPSRTAGRKSPRKST
jgi:uncharacterized protein YeaO (DUF488 family)